VLDGIIYASLIGFGFAMTEDIFYFGNVQGDLSAWSTIVLGRTLAFGFSHAMFTSFTGVGFGLASYLRSRLGRVVVVLLGLLAAITTHLFHNFFLSAGDFCLVSFLLDWMGVGVIFVIILLAWWRERSWIKEHLADEVAAGVLTSSQLQDIVAWHRRLLRTWRALGDGGWRRARLWRKFAQAATELAFKKRQLATVGEEEKLEAAIVSARADVVRLGKELGGKPFTVEG